MLNNVKTIAGILTALSISSVNATEVSVSDVLSVVVDQAVAATTYEIQNSIEQAVVQTAHVFSLDSNNAQMAKVTITDIQESTATDAE